MLYSVIFSVVSLNVNFFLPFLFQKRINLRTLWISKQMVKLNQSKKSPQNFSQGDQTFEKDFWMLHLLPQWHLYWRLSKTCAILLWWRYELKLWKYGLWSFQARGYKIRNIFALESTYPKEIIEFWINGGLSKIGHHFSNKII